MKNDKTISDEPQGGGKHGEGKYLPKRNKTWIVIAVIVAIIALTIIMM
ncbi:MAG: hypothetical protein ACLFQA_00350 [Bacteroidales bacterium]